MSATTGQGPATVSYSVQPNPNGSGRRGHVVVSDQTVEVTQAAAACRYDVSPSSVEVDAAERDLAVVLTATPDCRWTARSDATWLRAAGSSDGVGSATVHVAIAANTAQARVGLVTIGNATVSVNQTAAGIPAPGPPSPTPSPSPTPTPTPNPTPTPSPTPACSYGVSPSRISIDASGGQRLISVTAQGTCTWNATTTASWIAFASDSTGSGSGSLSVTVAGNSGAARTATVNVGGQTVTIEQAAPVAPTCTYAIKPTYYNAGPGPDTVTINVAVGAGCAWTARTDAKWVTVDAGRTGSGNGIVRLQVEPNDGVARTAIVTIAGESFTLHQEGQCSYAIKPTFYHAGRGPDDITLNVTTDPGCRWTASSSVAWVTVAEGSTGSGSGKVRLLVGPNDGPPRSVTLSIAGEPFDLRQDGRD